MPAPSAESPLTGRCACGAVRFTVAAPFESARYCHCHNCQRRTGTSSSATARVVADAFGILQGRQSLRQWQPEGGQAKWYCAGCGGHIFSLPEGGEHVFVRLGALDADPGIRPEYRHGSARRSRGRRSPRTGSRALTDPGT